MKYLSNKKGFLGIDNSVNREEKVVVVPFGLEKTVSYGGGTSKGPKEIINNIKTEFHKRKIFIHSKLNELKNISCFEPGGAFYAFPNVSKTGLNGQKFSDIALQKKVVALVPGTSFGDSAKDFVRISYANSMENLEKALYRISTI